MNIQLVHPFINRAHDILDLLKDVKKLSSFCNKLEKQSTLFPDRYKPEDYKGHGLELFTEALIKLSPIDNRVGIGNYVPITNNDIGVDGTGVSIVDGLPVTVQVKYRSNTETVLSANMDHLSNFVSGSLIHYGVKVDSDKKHMLIITTAKGLHHYTDEEMFANKVMCLGNEELRRLVDNNLLFWDNFRTLVKEAI